MKNLFPPGILALALLFTSCDSDTVFKKNDDKFPQFRWEKGKEAVFEPEIDDTSLSYDVSINFRHVQGFQFRDLLLTVTRISPSGTEVSRNFDMSVIGVDDDYLSSCALDICDLQADFETGVRFDESGKYTYRIQHRMPLDPLPNVMEIGLVIRKAGA